MPGKEKERGLALAARVLNPERGVWWYVSELPGQGGVDWGYNKSADKAIKLTPYWQKRFRADMRRVGAQNRLIPIVNGYPDWLNPF